MSINNLEITDVIIFPVRRKNTLTPHKENNCLLAFARMVLNDIFIVSGIKIYEGRHKRLVKMPCEFSKQTEKAYDYCFPITNELENYINEEILKQAEIVIPADKKEEKLNVKS